MTDLSSSKVYAAKIIPHARVSKPHQREKVALTTYANDITHVMRRDPSDLLYSVPDKQRDRSAQVSHP